MGNNSNDYSDSGNSDYAVEVSNKYLNLMRLNLKHKAYNMFTIY